MAVTRVVDASAVNLTDLTTHQMQEFPKLREGHETALEALTTLMGSPEGLAMLKRAGTDVDDVTRAAAAAENRKKAEALLPAAEALARLLRETIVADGKVIADVMSEASSQAQRRAEKDPKGDEILAAFEPVIKYQVAPAVKALATKKAKAEAENPTQ